jgi:predicted phage terminase large subunit-like protein
MPWRVLTLTAEAKEDDVLGRKPGESLYAERLPSERIAELKSDAVTWAALYQQETATYSGKWFDRSSLQFYKSLDHSLLNRYIAVDPANSKKKTSDYTAIFVFGVGEDHNYYWLHMLRDRLDPMERAQALIKLHRLYKPITVGYEEYGMQADIFYIKQVQEKLNYRFHIEPVGMHGPHRVLSTPDRIRTLLPLFNTGQIYLPEHQVVKLHDGREEDMVPVFIEKEYLKYPSVSHDDMLVAMARMTDPLMKIEFPIAQDERPPERPDRGGRTWMSA